MPRLNLSAPVPHWLSFAAAAAVFLLLGTLAATTDAWRADESFSVWIVELPPAEMWRAIIDDVHPPLFYLLLKIWRHWLPSPGSMRVLTILFALAAVLIAGWLGRRCVGGRAGIFIILLLAGNPQWVNSAQDVRMYVLCLLCEMIAVAGWTIARERPRLGWTLLVGGSLGAAFSHNFGLLFVAALFAWIFASVARSKQTRPAAGNARPGFKWAVYAACAVGVGYAPWLPVLIEQSRHPFIDYHYQALQPDKLAVNMLVRDFWMDGASFFAWAPGMLTLIVLPIAGWLLTRRRNDPAHGGVSFFFYLWLAPVAILLAISWIEKPVFAFGHRSVLFTPFLLLAAAAALSKLAERPAGRAIAYLIVLGMIGWTAGFASRTRDFDYRPLAENLLQNAPLGKPIITYPPFTDQLKLLWAPLAITILPKDEPIPPDLNELTLIVHASGGEDRSELIDRAGMLMERCASVEPIFTSYGIRAYHLRGIAPGALARLYQLGVYRADAMPDIQTLLGRHSNVRSWTAESLANAIAPRPDLMPFNRIIDDYPFARLAGPTNRLTISLSESPTTRPMALAIGGYLVSGGHDETIEIEFEGSSKWSSVIRHGDFMIAGTIPEGTTEARAEIFLPDGLARMENNREFALLTAGLYLKWAVLAPFEAETFRDAAHAGEFYDFGTLGDQIFLRSTIHEREGAPPATVRWTTRRCAIDFYVEPGVARQRVVLHGMLAAAIEDRRVSVRVRGGGAGGEDLVAERAIENADWAPHVFDLPAAIAPGIHRLEIETRGVWVPAETGESGDPRELGLLLDGIEITN